VSGSPTDRLATPGSDGGARSPARHAGTRTHFSDEPLSAKHMPGDPKWRDVSWVRIAPFIAMHLGCLAVIWVGFSWPAFWLAIALYVARMFFITGFYHRYFSHRTFRTSRTFQAVMAVLGLTAVQRGPIWWASHHRHHHRHADEHVDLHAPNVWGTLWAHMFWFTTEDAYVTRTKGVPDLMKYPELVWLNRHDVVVYVSFALLCYAAGVFGGAAGLSATGPQALVWGFCVSTVLLYHGTYTINSLAHRFGSRRYATRDDSRNNWLLALLTLGEGWHNNHHHYPGSARQGFFWWEIDMTYWGLAALQRIGLIHDLRAVPEHRRESSRIDHGTPDPLATANPGGSP